MLNSDNASKTIQSEGQVYTVPSFKCVHCGREYSDATLDIAVFLYGVFFLAGKERGYAGITCPCCLETILLNGPMQMVHSFKRSLSLPLSLVGFQIVPRLQYNSSVMYMPKRLQALKEFDILSWETALNGESQGHVEMRLHAFMESEPWMDDRYLCSFISGEEPPMGHFFSALWFREEEIEALVELESKEGLRVFPRYVHYNPVLDATEKFVWNKYLFHAYYQDHNRAAEKDLRALEAIAKEKDVDITQLAEANPGIAFQFDNEPKDKSEELLTVASDFMAILAADPTPWSFPLEDEKNLFDLWKTKSPFLGQDIPKNLSDLNTAFPHPSKDEPDHAQIVDELAPHLAKGYVQDFLNKRHMEFAAEYVEAAGSPIFSYADLWELKERYLRLLYDHVHKEAAKEAKFRFVKEGPSWTITFEGRTIRGLKGKGFWYIHYLVEREERVFHTNDLAMAIDGCHVTQPITISPLIAGDNNSDAEPPADWSGQEVDTPSGWDRPDMGDQKTLRDLLRRSQELKDDIREAEAINDLGTKEKAVAELENIRKFHHQYFQNDGTCRKFRDDSTRNKDRITKSIERALKLIKKHDKKVWHHFHEALGPVNSYDQSYGPIDHIDWVTT